MSLKLEVLKPKFAILKLKEVPDLSILKRSVFAVSKTDREISLLCEHDFANRFNATQADAARWRCIYLVGAFGFSEAGILVKVLNPLAAVKIGVLAFSTFDADLILVKESDFENALRELRSAGHKVTVESGGAGS